MESQLLRQTESKFNDTLDHLHSELAGVRSGRASTGLVDSIKVEVYGQSMPLKAIATISTPDSKTIQIQPWDQSNLAFIEKALTQNQNLGLNPSNDGRVVRVTIPPLSEETRTQLARVIAQKAEAGNISLRNARHEAINAIKTAEKSKALTIDQATRLQKDIDKLAEAYQARIHEVATTKEQEIMSV